MTALFLLLTLHLAPHLLRGQGLKASWNGKELRVSAPDLRFLTGRPLDQLHNGRAVAFDFHLSLNASGGALRRVLERFIISYDLWEERFSVTSFSRDRPQRRSASHLARNAAEAWCLETLSVSTEGIAADRPLTARLEVRAEEPRSPSDLSSEPAISLTALIEIFSRPARVQQARWSLEWGPLRLNDIRP
ncbi:MAG: hypothetical protein HY235_13645 [Acidobacteria bacterium]|nr:hypothetical protein [Acidobacteriota bacterium]